MSKVRTRKRGKTWSYIFEAGKKGDGKRKVVEKGGFASREAAYDAGTAAYTDWKHGNIGITSETITVNEFVKHWLTNVSALNVKPTTLDGYSMIVKLRIVPHFGGVTVQGLTPAMLDAWMTALLKEGLAKATIRKAYVVLRLALDYAVYPAELIRSNPIRYIKIPRSAPTDIIKRVIIPPERLDALLEKYPFGTPMYMPILLLYHTGMRIGELAGLSWDAIDLDR